MRQGPDSGSAQCAGNTGAASSSRTRPRTGSLSRVGTSCAPSGHVDGFGKINNRSTSRPTAYRSPSYSRTESGKSDMQTGSNLTSEKGASSGSLIEGNMESDNASSGKSTLQERHGDRQLTNSGIPSTCSQHSDRCQDFVPRRPLTRSCTHSSLESLEPESGHKLISYPQNPCYLFLHLFKQMYLHHHLNFFNAVLNIKQGLLTSLYCECKCKLV